MRLLFAVYGRKSSTPNRRLTIISAAGYYANIAIISDLIDTDRYSSFEKIESIARKKALAYANMKSADALKAFLDDEEMKKALLKQALIELYHQFHIDWDTDITKLKNTDFPAFADLHILIEKKSAEHTDNTDYRNLALLLADIAHGSDSFLWNGYSTIEAHSRCVCLDTHSLQNTSDNIKRTQYFNLLTWC